MSLDSETGLGIILDAKVHQGSSDLAGEFGHIPLTKKACFATVENGCLRNSCISIDTEKVISHRNQA